MSCACDSNCLKRATVDCCRSPVSFKHAGDLGDTVLFLPNLKYRPGSRLLLSCERGRVRDPYTLEHANVILPLLRSQDYIAEARLWCEGDECVDGSSWRGSYNGFSPLCHAQLIEYGTPLDVSLEPWLRVFPRHVSRVVINRSLRYHGALNWGLLRGDDCVFVGLRAEWLEFCDRFFKVPYYETKDLLEVAEVIAGCELFVGNQSAPYAIAEGLKHRLLQATCRAQPNNIYLRDGAMYSLYEVEESVLAFVQGLK